MSNSTDNYHLLSSSGMRITPQRMAIIDALTMLRVHPTAEQIADHLKQTHPNLSFATIYYTLEKFVENGIATKISTGGNVMRYDVIDVKHHHLYSNTDNRIDDYFDDELNELLKKYFEAKQIKGFNISDIRLEIRGEFTDK